MATFNELTPSQQAQVLAFMPAFRSTIGFTSQALNRLNQLDLIWKAGIGATIELLDSGTIIPDAPNTAGSDQLVKEELQALVLASQNVLDVNNGPTERGLYIKVAGLLGVMG